MAPVRISEAAQKRARRAKDLLALAEAARGKRGQEPEIGPKTPPRSKTSRLTGCSVAPRKRRNKPSSRKRAFLRLKALCRIFVLLRAKHRTGGRCEIAMSCWGLGNGTVWYHGWPQKGGNGLKYDTRSHFASCDACNMGEYGARMRGSDIYVKRHKELLGEELFAELDALHGRRQISTAEAKEMVEVLLKKIEAGEWR